MAFFSWSDDHDLSDGSYEEERDEYECEDYSDDNHYEDEDDAEGHSSYDTDEETEEEDEDNSNVIEELMASRGVKASEIPHHSKRQGVRGFGRFGCSNPECDGRRWSSCLAHIVIDLRAQYVTKVWKQKCMECEEECEPSFNDEELIRMVEKAIKQEKRYRSTHTENGTEGGHGHVYSGPPHESSLCEKCGYGEGPPCWQKT